MWSFPWARMMKVAWASEHVLLLERRALVPPLSFIHVTASLSATMLCDSGATTPF
jgi:hypothetical protein